MLLISELLKLTRGKQDARFTDIDTISRTCKGCELAGSDTARHRRRRGTGNQLANSWGRFRHWEGHQVQPRLTWGHLVPLVLFEALQGVDAAVQLPHHHPQFHRAVAVICGRQTDVSVLRRPFRAWRVYACSHLRPWGRPGSGSQAWLSHQTSASQTPALKKIYKINKNQETAEQKNLRTCLKAWWSFHQMNMSESLRFQFYF